MKRQKKSHAPKSKRVGRYNRISEAEAGLLMEQHGKELISIFAEEIMKTREQQQREQAPKGGTT